MPEAGLLESIDGRPRVEFVGQAFRHTGPLYGPLETAGARTHGGRWNPPNSFPVLYLALSVDTAAAEFFRTAERQGMPADHLLPRRLHRYEVRLVALLELRSSPSLAAVGLDELAVQQINSRPCQQVGEAAHHLGFEGIWAPSASGVGEVLAVFWDRITPGSSIRPVDSATWESLPRRPERKGTDRGDDP
jgi:RES domain-containing protein